MFTGLFICQDGTCFNVTGQLQCTAEKETEHELKCRMLKIGSYVVFECASVTGIHMCNNGKCFLMHEPECHRICFNIPTRNKNVVLLSGNRMFAAKCSSVYAIEADNSSSNGTLVFEDSDDSILMASCLEIVNSSMGLWEASDCINGTIFNGTGVMDSFVNFTTLTHLHYNLSVSNPATQIAPLENNLTISTEIKLQINQEGCVNSLKDECHDFYKNYSANGSDYNAVMR